MKPEYNVANFYKRKGHVQAIARSTWFDNLTLFVIGMNSIWIAIDTDLNDAPTLLSADLVFQIVENMFCVYFVVEMIIRFCAFAHKSNCLKDRWFVFDLGLVIMMVAETWIM